MVKVIKTAKKEIEIIKPNLWNHDEDVLHKAKKI